MSRLTELIRQAKDRDPALGAELEREYRVLSSRRAFGLNFERHRPEAVELPNRPVRRGDKVRVLAPRGSVDRADQRLWRVVRIEKAGDDRVGHLEPIGDDGRDLTVVSCDDLVVVAEFRDPIHPGLLSTGSVDRGGDKPSHTVINGENFHVLKALTFTHRGRVDAIYIDPPYNTGHRDWKYNNDYVEGDDLYRHSKWLAFMERRLQLARELLNPNDSILVVAIDEREFLRLGLLLEQLFPDGDVQMVTVVTNRAGSPRAGRFSRAEEYLFFVFLGTAAVARSNRSMLTEQADTTTMPNVWFSAIRVGTGSALRGARPGLFYPVHLAADSGRLHSVGEPLGSGQDRNGYVPPVGTLAMWPLSTEGREQTWRFSAAKMREYFERGWARLGRRDQETGERSITYLRPGTQRNIAEGVFKEVGRTEEGAVVLDLAEGTSKAVAPASVWNVSSHYARDYGSRLNSALIPDRPFPYPKSLYAVEDTLRFCVGDKPDAVVVDFFAGSGTTAHATMRLNRQDGGRRRCILVTNNEVAADEHRDLRLAGLRPGDADWERWGICDFITKPRIEAAITGRTPDGEPIAGAYRFIDEFAMADGFDENAAFFTLTYESPVQIGHNRAFARIAPLLWLRAGAEGNRIDSLPDGGWELADNYGLLVDLDQAGPFAAAIDEAAGVRVAYVVTDDDRRFQSVARRIRTGVEPVRLYESYLSNFRFTGLEP